MPTRATELLRVVHARPGVTRADAARLIGVGTGATTELVGRLGQAELLAEGPTAPSGARGRPTTPPPTGRTSSTRRCCARAASTGRSRWTT
ncbi:hypothetical protein AB0C29_37470, partial [Actinoplanes sp. NPDC048791]